MRFVLFALFQEDDTSCILCGLPDIRVDIITVDRLQRVQRFRVTQERQLIDCLEPCRRILVLQPGYVVMDKLFD